MSSRIPLLPWCCRALAAAAVVGLVACGGADDKASKQQAASQKVAIAGAHVALQLASIDLQSAGETKPLDEATKRDVMTQTRQYVEEAVVRPLLKGKKAAKQYAALFGPTVAGEATRGADRGALTDEGVGKVSGDVRAPITKVSMHALQGADGSVQYIATNFLLKVRSTI